jgi:glycosyltransferase involved in cell wall biosynthesis
METIMNILMITPFFPYPAEFGGTIRTYHLAKELAKRNNLFLLSFKDRENIEPEKLQEFCKQVELIPFTDDSKRAEQLKTLLKKRSYQTQQYESQEMQNAIDRTIKENNIELIFVEFSQMGFFSFPADIPVLLDEHNIEFDLLDRMSDKDSLSFRKFYNKVEAKKFEKEEISFIKKSAITITTSQRDIGIIKSYLPETLTAEIINGVDCAEFKKPDDIIPEKNSAVFTGAMNYFPNDEGVNFFMEEIYPFLQKKDPNFKITIVGSGPSEKIKAYKNDNINITGFVKDVKPYMWNSSVFIVPLRMGGGTRFKVVEAMAAGIPVVSTSLGCEGIPGKDGEHLLIRDDPSEFADAVFEAATNKELAERLSINGMKFAKENVDWEIVGNKLENEIKNAVSKFKNGK